MQLQQTLDVIAESDDRVVRAETDVRRKRRERIEATVDIADGKMSCHESLLTFRELNIT